VAQAGGSQGSMMCRKDLFLSRPLPLCLVRDYSTGLLLPIFSTETSFAHVGFVDRFNRSYEERKPSSSFLPSLASLNTRFERMLVVTLV
jgi:hypothetical protein